MKRMLTAVGLLALVALALAPATASAGEWNPGRGYIFSPPNDTAGAHSKVLIHPNSDDAVGPAASICAFSGRDDTDAEDDEFWAISPAGGQVQSPGQVTAITKEPPLQGAGCGPSSEEP